MWTTCFDGSKFEVRKTYMANVHVSSDGSRIPFASEVGHTRFSTKGNSIHPALKCAFDDQEQYVFKPQRRYISNAHRAESKAAAKTRNLKRNGMLAYITNN